MDLDNINDIEVLREAAKYNRVRLKKDVISDDGDYTFQKGFWYFIEQDKNGVYIFTDRCTHSTEFTYETAREYLEV